MKIGLKIYACRTGRRGLSCAVSALGGLPETRHTRMSRKGPSPPPEVSRKVSRRPTESRGRSTITPRLPSIGPGRFDEKVKLTSHLENPEIST